jgi:hypothetical protein
MIITFIVSSQNEALSVLDLQRNPIGDLGVSAIGTGLMYFNPLLAFFF